MVLATCLLTQHGKRPEISTAEVSACYLSLDNRIVDNSISFVLFFCHELFSPCRYKSGPYQSQETVASEVEQFARVGDSSSSDV